MPHEKWGWSVEPHERSLCLARLCGTSHRRIHGKDIFDMFAIALLYSISCLHLRSVVHSSLGQYKRRLTIRSYARLLGENSPEPDDADAEADFAAVGIVVECSPEVAGRGFAELSSTQ